MIPFETLYRDYTLNISHGGTFIVTEQKFNVGDQFRINISFPKLINPIPIDVEVIWTFEEHHQENIIRGIGVKFLFKSEYHIKKFSKLMDFVTRTYQMQQQETIKILFYNTNPFITTSFESGIFQLNLLEEFNKFNFVLRIIENEENLILNFLQESFNAVIFGGSGFDFQYYVQEFKKHDNLIPYIGLGIDKSVSHAFDLTLEKPFTTTKIKSLISSILKLSRKKR